MVEYDGGQPQPRLRQDQCANWPILSRADFQNQVTSGFQKFN